MNFENEIPDENYCTCPKLADLIKEVKKLIDQVEVKIDNKNGDNCYLDIINLIATSRYSLSRKAELIEFINRK